MKKTTLISALLLASTALSSQTQAGNFDIRGDKRFTKKEISVIQNDPSGEFRINNGNVGTLASTTTKDGFIELVRRFNRPYFLTHGKTSYIFVAPDSRGAPEDIKKKIPVNDLSQTIKIFGNMQAFDTLKEARESQLYKSLLDEAEPFFIHELNLNGKEITDNTYSPSGDLYKIK